MHLEKIAEKTVPDVQQTGDRFLVVRLTLTQQSFGILQDNDFRQRLERFIFADLEIDAERGAEKRVGR